MDKIAAEAAQKIAEYFGGTKESTAFYDAHGPFMSSVIQSALSQSLAERDRELWALIKEWETGRLGAKSVAGAEVRCAAYLRALLKGKAI